MLILMKMFYYFCLVDCFYIGKDGPSFLIAIFINETFHFKDWSNFKLPILYFDDIINLTLHYTIQYWIKIYYCKFTTYYFSLPYKNNYTMNSLSWIHWLTLYLFYLIRLILEGLFDDSVLHLNHCKMSFVQHALIYSAFTCE